MTSWSCAKGILVELGPTRTAVVATIFRDTPEGPWRERHDYVHLDPQNDCKVPPWTLDDAMRVTTFSRSRAASSAPGDESSPAAW